MNLKILTILLIVTTSSGCGLFEPTPYVPLCLERDVTLSDLTVAELEAIRSIDEGLLIRIATNDVKLKSVITKYEALAEAHNRVYGTSCEAD
jgi:hypothetical protein